jgi:hypothetical protein
MERGPIVNIGWKQALQERVQRDGDGQDESGKAKDDEERADEEEEEGHGDIKRETQVGL